MVKSQLIEVVAKKAHLTKKAAKEAVETIFDEIYRRLAKGEKVLLSGFGTFRIKKVRAKKGRKSPTDATPIIHKAHRVVRFIPSKTLKEEVK